MPTLRIVPAGRTIGDRNPLPAMVLRRKTIEFRAVFPCVRNDRRARFGAKFTSREVVVAFTPSACGHYRLGRIFTSRMSGLWSDPRPSPSLMPRHSTSGESERLIDPNQRRQPVLAIGPGGRVSAAAVLMSRAQPIGRELLIHG